MHANHNVVQKGVEREWTFPVVGQLPSKVKPKVNDLDQEEVSLLMVRLAKSSRAQEMCC